MSRRAWFRTNQEGWDPVSYEWYFATILGSTIRTREERAVYEFLGTVMERHHSVLEVGCGTGNYTAPVARRCAKVVAIDSSPEMLGYLRERLDREGLANVEARLGHLPDGLGAPEEFDGVLAVGVLNYVEDLEASLHALTSALEPGGWAIFNVPLTTVEGRIYALSELANRRRVHLYSPQDISTVARKAGLRTTATALAGLGPGGLSLVVGAVAAFHPLA